MVVVIGVQILILTCRNLKSISPTSKTEKHSCKIITHWHIVLCQTNKGVKEKPHFDRLWQGGEHGNISFGANNAQGSSLCQGQKIKQNLSSSQTLCL